MSASVLLAGALSALGVFALGVVREWLLRRRELAGLMRLLATEITHNANYLPELLAKVQMMSSWHTNRPLRMDTWEQTRTRVADLLPDDKKFQALTEYYSEVMRMNNMLDPHTNINILRTEALPLVDSIRKRGKDICGWIDEQRFLRLRF
jgi:hypothetical protein